MTQRRKIGEKKKNEQTEYNVLISGVCLSYYLNHIRQVAMQESYKFSFATMAEGNSRLLD